jgi:hypothetical protein
LASSCQHLPLHLNLYTFFFPSSSSGRSSSWPLSPEWVSGGLKKAQEKSYTLPAACWLLPQYPRSLPACLLLTYSLTHSYFYWCGDSLDIAPAPVE